ncbi:hypothetical protein CP556_06240 [Natrinema sp. CBA1119]|uniref:hypothetical protein n=1 Tax=Natrinema sp. CBA1119 TaxID=1608465 RepID=UPI000BF59934|nr:hypothetical protein [Natrinema sp. CBA1119]PGF15753.1 hypothetical protein CP556_06240 [Natrinema sp. CBA1119]
MYRRTVVAGSTAVLLAGCSELTSFTDDGYADSRVQDEQTAEFNAEAGEELTVTVENVAVAEPENETSVESTAISFRLDHAENGPIETRSISESETFDVTTESGGTHLVIVTSGAADVTVEPSE